MLTVHVFINGSLAECTRSSGKLGMLLLEEYVK